MFEPGQLTEWVNNILPYVKDFGGALEIFLYDILLRVLGALYIIAKITPFDWDDKIIAKITRRIRGSQGSNEDPTK